MPRPRYSLVALATPLFGAAVDRLGFGVGMIVTNTCLLASQVRASTHAFRLLTESVCGVLTFTNDLA